MTEVIVLSRDQYREDLEFAALRGAELALKQQHQKEKPLPRYEIMKELKIKDIRTFQRRVAMLGLKSRGTINRGVPVYLLSDFFK